VRDCFLKNNSGNAEFERQRREKVGHVEGCPTPEDDLGRVPAVPSPEIFFLILDLKLPNFGANWVLFVQLT